MFRAFLLFVIVILILGWIIMTPGLFLVEPTSQYPDGMTLLYYRRSSQIPFFYSASAHCLKTTGATSPMCQDAAVMQSRGLFDRRIAILPYSDWALQRSLDQ